MRDRFPPLSFSSLFPEALIMRVSPVKLSFLSLLRSRESRDALFLLFFAVADYGD